MVGFVVDILGCIVGFCVGHILSVAQVQCDVEEVYDFLVCLDSDF